MSPSQVLAELDAAEEALGELLPQAKELRRVSNEAWAEVRLLTARRVALRAEATRLLGTLPQTA